MSLLLSDAAAALDYDVAADVLDLLRVDIPSEDAVDDVWPEGDLALLAGHRRPWLAGCRSAQAGEVRLSSGLTSLR